MTRPELIPFENKRIRVKGHYSATDANNNVAVELIELPDGNLTEHCWVQSAHNISVRNPVNGEEIHFSALIHRYKKGDIPELGMRDPTEVELPARAVPLLTNLPRKEITMPEEADTINLDKLLALAEVIQHYDVSDPTLRKYLREGRLKSQGRYTGRHGSGQPTYYFCEEDVARLWKKRIDTGQSRPKNRPATSFSEMLAAVQAAIREAGGLEKLKTLEADLRQVKQRLEDLEDQRLKVLTYADLLGGWDELLKAAEQFSK